MARIARTETGIARAAVLDKIAIAVAIGDEFDSIQALICRDENSDGMAAATRDCWGGGKVASILDAMIHKQKNRCLLCSAEFWSLGDCDSPDEAGTIPNVFLLIPSKMWRDDEIGGYAAHESGWVPGNMIAACINCTNKRDRASEAIGESICVMADMLTQGQQSAILLTFPKTVKKSQINQDSAYVAKRDAIRMQALGF